MDYTTAISSEQTSNKRPRSPTTDSSLPAAKVPRTSGQLQINYFARQHKETIPLVTVKDQLPEILRLIGEYDGVLQRHESMAGNLGACPLGPILLKRFERLFDGPPRILKSHARDANVTWIDVVEFARNKPEQFNLEKMRNGIRVCQFYTKQCRVEISEEDFVLVASGMPEKLIPPQPILEDEEKELGVMDLLDRNLGQVIQIGDQVSARARQLIHKMKNRRAAILARREAEAESSRRNTLMSNDSPMSPPDHQGSNGKPVNSVEQSQSPPMGFTAVNRQPAAEAEKRQLASLSTSAPKADDMLAGSGAGNVTYINGRSVKDASPTERAELMKQFMSVAEHQKAEHARRESVGTPRQAVSSLSGDGRPRSESLETLASHALKQNMSTVAIPNTPAALMPQMKPMVVDRDDGGPFKTEMIMRMEIMQRGERVLPPCDRCRRLHMDCLKNLTACMGCTKKHAKCSWKDVRADELGELETEKPEADTAGHPQHQSNHTSPGLAPATVADVSRVVEDNRAPEAAAAISVVEAEVQTPSLPATAVAPSDNNTKLAETVSAPHATPPMPTLPNPPSRADSADRSVMTPKFDVRPPPLAQGPLHENRRSPPQPQHSSFTSSYAVKENARPIEDENDEGDRLEALARSTYRSYSQSVRSPEH